MTQVSNLFLSLSTEALRQECAKINKIALCRKSAIAILIAAGLICKNAQAHDIYTDWKRPDFPSSSCCSNVDCAPTVARWTGDHWQARAPDGRWLDVPEAKILKFDSPDGGAHLCKSLGSDEIYCFMRPGVQG